MKLDYAPGPSQAALGPGASYTENTTVDVPVLAPGTYHLLIETDSGDVQSETDKSDNLWSSQVITVSPPQVDLVMTATAPATATVGDGHEVSVSYTVTNQGSEAATGYWTNAVYLSDKPTLDDTARRIQSLPTGILGATSNLSFSLPGNITGEEYLLFVANDRPDQNDGQDETDFANNVYPRPIKLVSTNVDLALFNASYVDKSGDVPASVEAGNGQPIYLRWTAQNQGSSAPAWGWPTGVYLSNNANVSASSIPLTNTIFGDALAPSQEQVITGTTGDDVTVPNVSAGTYDLLLVADPDDEQGELRMTNNAVAMPITLTTPNVNLQVTAPDAPATAVAGGTIPLTWQVANQGQESASGGWFDEVYISDVPELTPSAEELASVETDSGKTLGPGGAYITLQQDVTVPSATGQRWLLFVTNAARTQRETDYADDVRAVPITITNGLAASDVSAAQSSVVLGQPIELSWKVTNTSDVTTNGSWTDSVYIAPTPISDQAVQITVTDPELHITVNTSPSTPLVVGNNAAFELDYTVANHGSVPTNAASWVDKLYASDKSTFDGSAQFIGDLYTNTATLSANGGYYEVDDTDLKLPNLPATDQYLLIVTDADGGQVEADGEGGDNIANVAAVSITPQVPNVNLAPSASGTPPTTIYQGDTPTFTVTNDVTSDGDTASAGWTDALYFSTSSTLDQNAVLLESDEHSAPLAPGESYSFDGSIPALPLGPGYLLFVTNVDGTQGETDVSDDTYSVPVTVAAPDLAISDASVSQTPPPEPGQPVSVSWTVRNQGGAPAADSWADAVYLSDKPTYDGSATLLGEFQENANAPLAQNQTYTDTESITIPASVPGDILNDYLLVIANASAGQQEADGGGAGGAANNLFAVSLGALAPNDLKVADVTAPTSGFAGQGFEVSWTDENEGTQPTVGSWTDSVYLSTGTQPAHGALIAQISMNQPLAAGASLVSDHQFLLPGTPGGYYVIVTTDADGPWAGSREIAVSELPIQVAPVDLPDLVASVDTPSDGFLSGAAVPVTYTVTNNGNVPTTVPT